MHNAIYNVKMVMWTICATLYGEVGEALKEALALVRIWVVVEGRGDDWVVVLVATFVARKWLCTMPHKI